MSELLQAAYKAFYKTKLSIDQVCNGLDVLGVLNLIRSHPESVQPYLLHNTDTLLTPALLFNQFHNIDKMEDGTREVTRQHLKRSISYGVPFPPKFNVQFYIVLCTIYPTFCVCHLSLQSQFNFFAFNFDLCNIQVLAFDIQLFISNSQVLEFYLQVQWNVHSFFLIQHLEFFL